MKLYLASKGKKCVKVHEYSCISEYLIDAKMSKKSHRKFMSDPLNTQPPSFKNYYTKVSKNLKNHSKVDETQ